MTALGAGSVDAVIQVIGTPADEIRSAAAAMPLRLLPIDAATLAKLTAEDRAFLPGHISKGTYPGIAQDVDTAAVAALLVTTASLSEAEAATLVKAIFGNKADLLTAGSTQGGQSASQRRIWESRSRWQPAWKRRSAASMRHDEA